MVVHMNNDGEAFCGCGDMDNDGNWTALSTSWEDVDCPSCLALKDEKESLSEVGLKYDSEKLRWDRVPFDIIEDLAEVMTYGAKKYKEESDNPNWRETEDGYNRYFAAMMRHLVEDRKGNYLDEESGLPHMSHVLFTAVALCKFSKDKHVKGEK